MFDHSNYKYVIFSLVPSLSFLGDARLESNCYANWQVVYSHPSGPPDLFGRQNFKRPPGFPWRPYELKIDASYAALPFILLGLRDEIAGK